MKKINYAENKNAYMPTFKMKVELSNMYKYIHEYPDYKNIDVNNSVAKYFNINSKNVTVTNGSLEGINLLVGSLKRKKATLFQPTFWGYEDALNRYNYNVKNINLDKNIEYDYNAVYQEAKNSEIMIICNPNNPTLSSIGKKALIKLIKDNQNCHFIIDETMLIFDVDFKKKTVISEVSKHNNLSVVVSFSKFLGIAGLRTGCLISNYEIVENVKKISVPYSFGTEKQRVLPIALSNSKYLNKTRYLIQINRERMCKLLEDIGCKVRNGNTNFILVQLPQCVDSNEVTELLSKDKITVRNIKESYPLLEGDWLRISLHKPKYNKFLINKMNKIIKKLKNK